MFRGHLGLQWSKGHFHQKMLFFLQISWHGHLTYAYAPARCPLQQSKVNRSHWVHLGSLGSNHDCDRPTTITAH